MGSVSIQVGTRRRVSGYAGSRAPGAVAAIAPFVLALAGVLALQVLDGAYSAPIAGHPDEPGHVVTSLLYRQFLLAPAADPLQFAQDYYSHYPYLGAGHWPPMLHLSAAIWTLLAGAGKTQLILYLALAAAASAALLYRSVLTIGSARLAMIVVATWMALDPSRTAFSRFMAEGPLACLTLAAVVVYIRYLRTPNYRLALLFAGLSSAAILTKETAVALAVVPPLAVAALRQWDLLRKGHFWLPAGIVLALAGSWHLWVAGLGVGRFRRGVLQRLLLHDQDTVLDRLALLVVLLGWPLLLLAAAGLADRLVRINRQDDSAPLWIAHAGLLAGGLLVLVITPESKELRHLYHLTASFLIFAAAGAWSLTQRLRGSFRGPAAALLGVSCILFSPISFARNTKASVTSPDASAIAQYLASRTDAQIILISGSVVGSEGPLIAEAALLEPAPARYFIRASKTIYSTDWDAKRYRPLIATLPELKNFIDSSGIDAIVRLPGGELAQRPDQALLSRAIADGPDVWVSAPVDFPGGSRIYRRVAGNGTERQPIRIQTSSKLGHDLIIEIPPEPVPPAPVR